MFFAHHCPIISDQKNIHSKIAGMMPGTKYTGARTFRHLVTGTLRATIPQPGSESPN